MIMEARRELLLLLFLHIAIATSFTPLTPPSPLTTCSRERKHVSRRFADQNLGDGEEEVWSDFEGYTIGDVGESYSYNNLDSDIHKDEDMVDESQKEEDALISEELFQTTRHTRVSDLTACQSRQFSLGQDLVLADFVGNMGFDEVTDWEYYYPNDEDPDDRKVVNPNPFDKTTPKRTRTSSGSVVRIFRGEFVGLIGGMLSAQGLDRRVLVKEFTGDLALSLAQSELQAVGKLQSELMSRKSYSAKTGEWIQTAGSRSVKERQDNSNVAELLKNLKEAPFLGILGEVNLAELEGNMEPNEFYRALSVPPPKPGAVWLVYEYAGLSTIQAYAQPAEKRRGNIPLKKGFFGNVIQPPPLPAWRDRANYVVNGIVKEAIEGLAILHDSGFVHRSIGRTSMIVSSTTMDKTEAISPFTTMTSKLVVKLSDFGFSGLANESTLDEGFRSRARTFGLSFKRGETSVATTNFAIAEDMHAIGFVFLGLLLTSLAELPDPNYQIPATDEDTLQRLLGDIFEKDFSQFREYVKAEDVWTSLVHLLDQNDGAGWSVLETLVLAREKAAKNEDTDQLFTIRGLLSNAFFK